jgi:hypothetical protein
MAAYANRFRARLLARLALLMAIPVFFVALFVGILEVRVLTDTWSVAKIALSVAAAAGAAALITSIGLGLTLPRCPLVLDGNGVSLTYRRLRWVGSRPGMYTLELPLSSIRSVGPTAVGAIRVDGVAFARFGKEGAALRQQVAEHLLLAPETAESLGLRFTRGLTPMMESD